MVADNIENGVGDEFSDYDTENQIEKSETCELVSQIIKKMPNSYGLLLTLFYLEDNSIKDIAEITGLNDSNVKVILFRARKMFKELTMRNYPELSKVEMI